MWRLPQDGRLLIDIGSVDDGERAVLRLECGPDASDDVGVNFVLSVEGRELGGGRSTNMFLPRSSVNMVHSPSGAYWMWGVVERECVSVTCDGRDATILRQPWMNRDFFLIKVGAEQHDLVFTSESGEQHGWSVGP